MVRQAHTLGLIPPQQFGSVPGSMAMLDLLHKVLSFDPLIRYLRVTASIFNNDAKACYDRVIPLLALLCCRRLGLSATATYFMLEFLWEATYHVKTGHGISDTNFCNRLSEVYGVLQGSGSAPPISVSYTHLTLPTILLV